MVKGHFKIIIVNPIAPCTRDNNLAIFTLLMTLYLSASWQRLAGFSTTIGFASGKRQVDQTRNGANSQE